MLLLDVILLTYLNAALGEWRIERKNSGDIIKESLVCRNQCSCGKDTTTYSTVDQSCIGATAGCNHFSEDFPVNIPSLSLSNINTASYVISNHSHLCMENYQPRGFRILLQNADAWVIADDTVTTTVSSSMNEGTIKFKKLWPGLLMKIQFECFHIITTGSYYPRKSCMYFKHDGELAYPWTIDSINGITTTKGTITAATPSTAQIISSTSTQITLIVGNVTTETATTLTTFKKPIFQSSTESSSTTDFLLKSKEKISLKVVIITVISGLFIIVIICIIVVVYQRKQKRSGAVIGKEDDTKNLSSENLYEPAHNTLLAEKNKSEIVYSQANYKEPNVEFSNIGYGNSITINQGNRNDNHNYINSEDLRKSATEEDSQYYNIAKSNVEMTSSTGSRSSLIQPLSEGENGNQYEKIWIGDECKLVQ